jgi:hypothetical protein
VAALEGTYASVIGGAPAAAVVFAGEVEARAKKDARLQPLTQAIARAEGAEKGRLRAEWDELFKIVHSEKLGEMASEFDRVHSVQRALDVGALSYIIPPANLRSYLIHAVERGIEKVEESEPAKAEERIRSGVDRAPKGRHVKARHGSAGGEAEDAASPIGTARVLPHRRIV